MLPTTAAAHLGSTKYVALDLTATGAHAVVDLDPIDVAYELELDAPDEADVARVLTRRDDVTTWATRRFLVAGEGGPCAAVAAPPTRHDAEAGAPVAALVRLTIDYRCAPARGLVFHDLAVFDGDAQHEAIVRFGDELTVLRRGRQTIALAAAPSLGGTLLTFLEEGALHLVTGYDHILFLLTLLLAAGPLAPRDGTWAALREIAKIVTGFTLGHSITLIAAALDVVTLPSRLVESAIALSIVVVAVWNIAKPDVVRGRALVAASFGLIHGFGFSSVLRELVLPSGQRVVALVAFNVGIELAQLALVAIAIAPLAWAARHAWYRPRVLTAGSAGIALVATYWFVERIVG